MDPVTLIGLLASISTLVAGSQEALKLLRSFKEGDKELSSLIVQVGLFEENLKAFDRLLRSRSRQAFQAMSAATLSRSIEDSSSKLVDLERRLLQICKAENSSVRRLRWIQNRSSFREISEDLRAKCGMMHSLVSTAQMYVHSPTRKPGANSRSIGRCFLRFAIRSHDSSRSPRNKRICKTIPRRMFSPSTFREVQYLNS